MKFTAPHPWELTPREAIALQEKLRTRVIRQDRLRRLRYAAGVDVGFEDAGRVARAAVAVLSFPDLTLVDRSIERAPVGFPYVPGLLSFREIPVVLRALVGLRVLPDVLLCDGQGYAHPRRLGIACHLGVITGAPSIGVAKTLLVGTHAPVPVRRGSHRPLEHRGETVGAALRTRAGVKPVFVSIGHKVSLEHAIEVVLACTRRYRLPETTRWAHRLASGPDV